jgi:hypothetical protein
MAQISGTHNIPVAGELPSNAPWTECVSKLKVSVKVLYCRITVTTIESRSIAEGGPFGRLQVSDVVAIHFDNSQEEGPNRPCCVKSMFA